MDFYRAYLKKTDDHFTAVLDTVIGKPLEKNP